MRLRVCAWVCVGGCVGVGVGVCAREHVAHAAYNTETRTVLCIHPRANKNKAGLWANLHVVFTLAGTVLGSILWEVGRRHLSVSRR